MDLSRVLTPLKRIFRPSYTIYFFLVLIIILLAIFSSIQFCTIKRFQKELIDVNFNLKPALNQNQTTNTLLEESSLPKGILFYVRDTDLIKSDFINKNPSVFDSDGAFTGVTLSPNKQWLSYLKDSFLYISSIDGSNKIKVYDKTIYRYSWSPNSEKIAFTTGIDDPRRSVETGTYYNDLYIYIITAKTIRKLEDASQMGGEIDFSWSPSSKYISYSKGTTIDVFDDNYKKTTILNSTKQVNTCSSIGFDATVQWDYQSKYLYFNLPEESDENCTNQKYQVYKADVSGILTTLWEKNHYENYNISNTESKVLTTTNTYAEISGKDTTTIYLSNLDGSNKKQIFSKEGIYSGNWIDNVDGTVLIETTQSGENVEYLYSLLTNTTKEIPYPVIRYYGVKNYNRIDMSKQAYLAEESYNANSRYGTRYFLVYGDFLKSHLLFDVGYETLKIEATGYSSIHHLNAIFY